MYPLDLSPHASSLPVKCIDFEPPSVRIRSFSESKIPNLHKRDRDQGKRGRPRAELLTALMVEGSSSRSRIRCNKCGRAFPREKSLQAHLRTHTGERPYICDYPCCMKAFCQSGQLKTHQRLHTGERPFICVVDGCTSRFTHANRHCTQHPYATLKRLEMKLEDVTKLCEDERNPEVIKWITKYITQCRDRTNPKLTLRKTPSTESMDKKSVKVVTVLNDDTFRSQSLPRIPTSLTVHNTQSPSPPLLLTSAPLPQTSMLSSPLAISSLVPRQSSASSSSSSGVSSMSAFSSSSISLLPLQQDQTILEHQSDVHDYIYSSQLILQGQSNDETQPLCSAPWSYRSTSPTIHDSNLEDYRTLPPTSPVLTQLLRSHTPTPPTDQFTPTFSNWLPAPVKPSCPLTQTLVIRPPFSILPIKPPTTGLPFKPLITTQPPTATLLIKPLTTTFPIKPPTLSLPQTIALSSKLATQNKSPTQLQVLQNKSPTLKLQTPPMSVMPSMSVNQMSESNSNETTSSISYRTTPKNREKDRYISALALIELSKG